MRLSVKECHWSPAVIRRITGAHSFLPKWWRELDLHGDEDFATQKSKVAFLVFHQSEKKGVSRGPRVSLWWLHCKLLFLWVHLYSGGLADTVLYELICHLSWETRTFPGMLGAVGGFLTRLLYLLKSVALYKCKYNCLEPTGASQEMQSMWQLQVTVLFDVWRRF